MLPKLSIFVIVVLCNYVTGYLRVCYYTNWSQYRPNGGKFTPENIQPKLCTHIIFSFGKLEGNSIIPFEWNDESTEWTIGMYGKVNNMKQKNPQLRTLLAMGGWNAGSLPYSDMVATSASRSAFVNSTIHYLRQRNFDGLDMDWEYPAQRGGRPEDKNNLVLLLSELKQAFEQESYHTGKPRLLLTAAVPAGKTNIDTGYDIPNVARSLDFINIMTYDMHGSWEPRTGHNSPLYGRAGESVDDATLNMDWTARYWVQQGAPKHKLIIGFGLYGRSFQLETLADNSLGARTIKAGAAGKYTREAGFMAYYEVCEHLKKGATRVWNNEQKIPYFHKGNLWVGYDDEESIREKINWLKQNKYGGAMIWSLALDDFSGTFCNKGRYPLLKTINRELRRKTNSTKDAANMVIHKEPPAGTTFISTLDQPTPKQKRSGHSQVSPAWPGGNITPGVLDLFSSLSNGSLMTSHQGDHMLSELVVQPQIVAPSPQTLLTVPDRIATSSQPAGVQLQSAVQLDPVRHHSPNGHSDMMMQAPPMSNAISHDARPPIILPQEVTNALLGNLSHADSQFPIIVGLQHQNPEHHAANTQNVVHGPAHTVHGVSSHGSSNIIGTDLHSAGHGPAHVIEGRHPQSARRAIAGIATPPEPVVIFDPATSGLPPNVIMDAGHASGVGQAHAPANIPFDTLPQLADLQSHPELQLMNGPAVIGAPPREIMVQSPISGLPSSGRSAVGGNVPGSIINSIVRAAQSPSSGVNFSFSKSSNSSSNSSSSSSNSTTKTRNINVTHAGLPFSSSSVIGGAEPVILQEGTMPVVAIDSGFMGVDPRIPQDESLLSFMNQDLPGELSIAPGSPGSDFPVTSSDSLAQILQSIPMDGTILLPPEGDRLSPDAILRELTIPNMVRAVRPRARPTQRLSRSRMQQPLRRRARVGNVAGRMGSNQPIQPRSRRIIQRGGRRVIQTRPRVSGTPIRTMPSRRRSMRQPRTQGLRSPFQFQRRQVVPPLGTRTRIQPRPTVRTRFQSPARSTSWTSQAPNTFPATFQPRRTGQQNNVLVIGRPSGAARQLSQVQRRINGNVRMIPWS